MASWVLQEVHQFVPYYGENEDWVYGEQGVVSAQPKTLSNEN